MTVSPSGSGTLFLANLTRDVVIDQPTKYPSSFDCFFISDTASVKANPNNGYKFDHWTLDPTPKGFNTKANPAVFVNDEPRRLTAYFTSGNQTPVPSAPTNVSATDGTYNDRVYISWNASSGATSYDILRSTSTSGLKPVIATVAGTSYNDTSTICGTTYYYWVQAKNSAGTSDLSSYNAGYCSTGGTDPPDDPPAGGVTALTASQAKEEIDETTGLIILDIREFNDFKTGHLLCAENAAWNSAFDFISYEDAIGNYKDIDLLIYDQDGKNGLTAANYLAGEGFSTVYYITGGLDAWEAKGYETVTTVGPCSIPPMANAGEDQTVAENAPVSLDGSGSSSSSGTLTYVWTQTSGPTVILLNPTTATPTFTAPYVQEGGDELIFHLKVTNAQQVADTDSVSVFVTWTVTPPVANAGANQTVDEDASVILNANGSTPANDIVSYTWTQTGGTPTVTLAKSPSSPVATFTAPPVSAQTTLTFSVTVRDASDNSDTDEVQITINDVPDAPTIPMADAGDDLIVDESTAVTLDGTGSSGGTITAYEWTQTSGTNVTLSNSNTATPSFTAPSITVSQETLRFQLIVTNSAGSSLPDSVTVLVKNVAAPVGELPVAHAGIPQMVYGGATVTLDGSKSMDRSKGGTIAAYQWQQTAGPDVSLSNASSPSPTFTAPLPDDSSLILEFELTVTDNDGNQDTDDVTVVVDTSPPPVADAGADQTVKEGATVTLDGSASTDDAGIMSYLWKQISGTPVSLSANNNAQVEFKAPKLQDGLEVLIFELTVEDLSGLQNSDMVAISVKKKSSSGGGCFISAME